MLLPVSDPVLFVWWGSSAHAWVVGVLGAFIETFTHDSAGREIGKDGTAANFVPEAARWAFRRNRFGLRSVSHRRSSCMLDCFYGLLVVPNEVLVHPRAASPQYCTNSQGL